MTRTGIISHVKEILGASNEKELEENLKKAQKVRLENFGKKIHFYAPSFMYYKTRYYCSSPTDFPTISVTGQGCALKCRHCGGKVLNTMYSATTPEKLYDLCTKLRNKGATGCLISGGCLPDGSVPLGKFITAIKRIKHELDLTIIVHTGIIDFDTAEKLKNSGVDAALIDIVGSNETIREIYKINTSIKAYENSLHALHKAGIIFVPHVTVGLHYGKLKGELQALQMIQKHEPSALVIIAFMPIHGTEMENTAPSNPIDIAKVITAARLMFPQTPLTLGCMRPKGSDRAKIDVLALKAGANAIAFPAEEAIRYSQKLGYKIAFSSYCCSQIYTSVIQAK